MRYDKKDFESAMKAARRNALVVGHSKYVVPTAYGYIISNSKLSWTNYGEVLPDGECRYHTYVPEMGFHKNERLILHD